MDAHALLSAQGWRGTGHSLHKTDDSIGLAKPLLLNRKTNTKGLGNTKHFTSDMWWMNAFDEQLKGLDTSKKGQVVQTVKTGKLNALDRGNVSKYSVYASFVRGGFLEGTISVESTDDSTSSDSEKSDDKKTETKATKSKKETKEEKRIRKEEKKKRKEARALRRAAKAERRLKRAEAKKDTSDSSSSGKEEKLLKRVRKEEKRKRKELKEKN